MSERQRDIELRDIKIESLESILKKRDAERQEHSSQVVAALEDKVRGLEGDREKLIKDNVKLIRGERDREEAKEERMRALVERNAQMEREIQVLRKGGQYGRAN